MKTLKQVNELLDLFHAKYGLNIKESKQGSEEWFTAKLGVLSASNASKIVAKRDSQARETYMCQLVAQVCTGILPDIDSKHMDWGKLYEDSARASYEFETGSKIIELPFVYKDETFRCGASPDGILDNLVSTPCELKSPYNSENHIKFIAIEKIKPEYDWQLQFSMWVMGSDIWEMGSYDERMQGGKIFVVKEFRADPEKQKRLDDEVPAFISDMDEMLASCGVKFGDQWLRLKDEKGDLS